MIRTQDEQFVVRTCNTTYLWIEILHGTDQGIRLSIPIYHDEYDQDLQETLQTLTEGDIVNADLESETRTNPNWRVNNITVEEHTT